MGITEEELEKIERHLSEAEKLVPGQTPAFEWLFIDTETLFKEVKRLKTPISCTYTAPDGRVFTENIPLGGSFTLEIKDNR